MFVAIFLDINNFLLSIIISNELSNSNFSITLIFVPICMFNFFKSLKKSSSSFIILDTIPLSEIFKSLKEIFMLDSITPNLLGIGSPCGSIFGYFK